MLSFRKYIAEIFDSKFDAQPFIEGNDSYTYLFLVGRVKGKAFDLPRDPVQLSALIEELMRTGQVSDPFKDIQAMAYTVVMEQIKSKEIPELGLLTDLDGVYELGFEAREAQIVVPHGGRNRPGPKPKYAIEWDAGSGDDLNIFDATTAAKIINTVVDIAKKVKARINPKAVFFGTTTKANPARGRIYKSLAKRAASTLGGLYYELGSFMRKGIIGGNTTIANAVAVWFDKSNPLFAESTQPLAELFEKPYSIRMSERSPANFPNGNYIIYTANTKSGLLEIEVANIGPMLPWEISFKVNDSTNLTQANEPFKIMATVLEAVKDFFERYTKEAGEMPSGFSFTAKDKESSRSKVYLKMVQKFGTKYGYKLDRSSSEGGSTLFVFKLD
jgi:hypothetical protein